MADFHVPTPEEWDAICKELGWQPIPGTENPSTHGLPFCLPIFPSKVPLLRLEDLVWFLPLLTEHLGDTDPLPAWW